MPASFAHSIRAPSEEEHTGQASAENDRSHPTDALHAPAREPLQHGRLEKPEGVAAAVREKQPER